MTDAAIDRLRAIAARLDKRRDPDAAWFAACLAEFESGARHGLTLGDAFGFKLSPGERPFWAAEACAARDEIIRAAAGKWFAQHNASSAARALLHAITRYERSGWRQHRVFRLPPAAIVGTLQADLFKILKTKAPISERTARRVLGHEPPLFVASRFAEDGRDPKRRPSTNASSSDEVTSGTRPGRD